MVVVDPFYARFRAEQFPGGLVVLHALFWLLSVLTILMNALIVAATVHSKKLREHCHLLIAAESLTNVVLQFYRWPPFFLALTGIQFINLSTCFWLQIWSLCFSLVGTGLILIIGIERLICLAFPFWYRKRSFKFYLYIAIAINVGHALYTSCLVYLQAMDPIIGQTKVMCQMGDLFNGQLVTDVVFSRGASIHICAVFVYVGIIMLLLLKYKDLPEATKSVSKSLLAIVLVELFFWLPVQFFPQFVAALRLDTVGIVYFSFIFYLCVAVATSANLPVLFCMSKLYRREICKFLVLLLPNPNGSSNGSPSTVPPNVSAVDVHSGNKITIGGGNIRRIAPTV